MAVDTARKRMSMLSFGRAGFSLPVADGSFDQGDRQHLLGLYSGILAEEAVEAIGTADTFREMGRSLTFQEPARSRTFREVPRSRQ